MRESNRVHIILWLYLFASTTHLFFSFLVTQRAMAHEGHAALPSKGVLVDASNQRITLTIAARNAIDIETNAVASGMVPRSMTCPATITLPWNQHAVISSPLAGRIVSLPIPSGTLISKGQMLAELECPELEQLHSDLRSAALEFQVAQQLVASTQQAVISGAVPGARLLDSKTRVEQAKAAMTVLAAKWKSFDLPSEILADTIENPEKQQRLTLPIRSTIDGYVTHIDLAFGKYVSQNEHLFEIIDIRKVWLKISVLESNLSKVKLGQRISVWSLGAPINPFESTIDCVDRFLDPTTHEGSVWSTIDNPSTPTTFRLKPGMSVVAEVQINSGPAGMIVPCEAILRDAGETFVMVEEELTKRVATYRRVHVTVGNNNGSLCEVTSGTLVPGDQVVIQGGYNLHYLLPHSGHDHESTAILELNSQKPSDAKTSIAKQTSRTFTGTFDVLPDHLASIGSLLDGTVAKIHVDRSQEVQRGEVIAELRSPEFQDLQLDFLQTHLRLEQAQVTLGNLASGGFAVPERQRIEAESLLKQTRTQWNAIRNRLLQLGIPESDLQKIINEVNIIPTLPIRAPISGTVIGFDQFLGKNIRAEQQLFTVQNLNYGVIQGFVPESEINLVAPGKNVKVEFSSIPDRSFAGKIARTNEAINPEDRTQSVWIELMDPIPPTARQGMLATIRLQSTAVPSSNSQLAPSN